MRFFCIVVLAPLVAACSTFSPPDVGSGTTVTVSGTTPPSLVYSLSPDPPPEGSGPIPAVRVQSTRGGLLVGRTEVTQAQWKLVSGDAPAWSAGADKPVEMVSWDMAAEFCNKLSALEKLPAAYVKTKDSWKPVPNSTGWRLPTVAEWEAAARGTGAKADLPGDAPLTELAWLWSNAAGETHAVANLQPNSLGLYDMAGNVREWCQDEGEDASWHLIKGGGVQSDDKWAAVSATEDLLANYHKRDLGLRVVRSLD